MISTMDTEVSMQDENDNDPLADPEEQRALMAALDSYESYRRRAHYNITHIRRQSFYALPPAHSDLLAEPPFSLLTSFNAIDDAIDANADIAEAIVAAARLSFLPPDFGNPNSDHNATTKPSPPPWKATATPSDLDKARSTLRQFARDWSTDGASERTACYTPVLSALTSSFSHIPDAEKTHLTVLVPGAGLARLLLEIVRAGFSAEGNEISYHQILGSAWVLNHTRPGETWGLHPYALGFSNHVSRADQLRQVRVPDVHPGTVLAEVRAEGRAGEMSFATGDFCVVYGDEEHREQYDAVASVFFIDTAPNLIRYVEAVRNCLKKGGVWINLGPLLWHFENHPPGTFGQEDREEERQQKMASVQDAGIGEAGSVELTDEEVILLVERFGFVIERHEVGERETGYIQDPRSMLHNIYKPSFWVARKK